MMDSWFYLSCPMCRSRLRIKSTFTHMRGRCPKCGARIEPPDPKPLSAKPAVHESSGMLLDEEEWPEPATVLEEAQSTAPTYAIDDKGSIIPAKKE